MSIKKLKIAARQQVPVPIIGNDIQDDTYLKTNDPDDASGSEDDEVWKPVGSEKDTLTQGLDMFRDDFKVDGKKLKKKVIKKSYAALDEWITESINTKIEKHKAAEEARLFK
jgi:hypothetical protein